jgi:hypothetical protein
MYHRLIFGDISKLSWRWVLEKLCKRLIGDMSYREYEAVSVSISVSNTATDPAL